MEERVKYEGDCLVLYDVDGREIYWIDLNRCKDSAELLDWIFQINLKTWATPGMMKALLNSIEDACLRRFNNNAQGVYCPGGRGQSVNWRCDNGIKREVKGDRREILTA